MLLSEGAKTRISPYIVFSLEEDVSFFHDAGLCEKLSIAV